VIRAVLKRLATYLQLSDAIQQVFHVQRMARTSRCDQMRNPSLFLKLRIERTSGDPKPAE
jgi:hypothetical protein